MLQDFYKGTTKKYTSTITFDGVNPDIRTDAVWVVFKTSKSQTDADAALLVEADVTSQGDQGKAIFNISKEESDIPFGNYYYEVKWLVGDALYILESSTVEVLQKVFD